MKTYLAKSNNFQVSLETEGIPLRDSNGIVVDRTRGKRVVFKHGTFVANDRSAREAGFASEAELIAALEDARSFNAEFFEVGQQPGAESPSLAEQMEAVAVLSAKQDAGKLREVLERELESYAREPVVNAAQRALGALGDLEMGKRPAGRPRTAKEIVG